MEVFESIRDMVIAFLVSASPLEMKAGIPLAILQMDMNPVVAYIVCCAANMLAFPISYWFFTKVHVGLFQSKSKYRRFTVKISRKAKNNTEELVQKYGFWGLLIFVAIPLPMTGAYMGTLAAWVLNIDRKKAYQSVALGTLFAAVIVTLLSVFAKKGIVLLS